MKDRASLLERRAGGSRAVDFQTSWYVEKVKPVIDRIRQELPDMPMDEKILGKLIFQMLQFMEAELGKEAKTEKPFPKLPVKPLWDFSPDGPLLEVAMVCYNFEKCRDWMVDDFSSQDAFPRRQCLSLLAEIRRRWEERGFIQTPHVLVDETCGGEVKRLKEIVLKLGGTLASSEGDPNVTHRVLPFGPEGDPDDGNQYLRALLGDPTGSRVFVHWWYLPDSHDSWIPAAKAPETLEPDKPAPKPWKVYVRFLYDSEKFNEWMNPIDYELEEEEEHARPEETSQGTSHKRGAETGDEPGAKRQRVSSQDEGEDAASPQAERLPEIMPGQGQPLREGVVKQVVGEPLARAMDGSAATQNISQMRQAEGVAAAAAGAPDPGPGAAEAAHPTEMYVVPMHSSWFRWDKVHDIERRALPEFFNGRSLTKTPKAYKEIRDFIINLYRQRKPERVTFTDCRKRLAGDASSLFRVWSFLDEWGLINYRPGGSGGGDQQQQAPLPPLTVQAEATPGGVRVVSASPAPENLFSFSKQTPQAAVKAAGMGGGGGFSLLFRPDRYGYSALTQPQKLPVRFFCNADPSHDCSAVRYHCTAVADVDVCPDCYANGRLPVGMSSKDFVRVEQQKSEPGTGEWTEQETLLLLEALEIHGESWADVAEHVGTRSQIQCIMQFLQLPIEDQFLNDMERTCRGATVPDSGVAAAPAESDAVPFANQGNPVMAQLAFLTTMVGPRVAAAAAQRALEVLSEDSDELSPEAMAMLRDAQLADNGPEGPTAKGSPAAGATPPQAPAPASGPPAEQGGSAAGAPQARTEGDAARQPQEAEGSHPERTDVAPGTAPSGPKEEASGTAARESAPGVKEEEVAEARPGDGTGGEAERAPTAEGKGEGGESKERGNAPAASGMQPPSREQMRLAAASALAAAAVKAKLLAEQEEREIQRLICSVIQKQSEKLEVKMRYFEALEEALDRERAALETSWTSLFAERAQLVETKLAQPQALQQLGGGPQATAQGPAAQQLPASSQPAQPGVPGLAAAPAPASGGAGWTGLPGAGAGAAG